MIFEDEKNTLLQTRTNDPIYYMIKISIALLTPLLHKIQMCLVFTFGCNINFTPKPLYYKLVTLYSSRAICHNLVTQYRTLQIMCYYLVTLCILCYNFVTLLASTILCVTNSLRTQLVCYWSFTR
jgi:hypothetical protein